MNTPKTLRSLTAWYDFSNDRNFTKTCFLTLSWYRDIILHNKIRFTRKKIPTFFRCYRSEGKLKNSFSQKSILECLSDWKYRTSIKIAFRAKFLAKCHKFRNTYVIYGHKMFRIVRPILYISRKIMWSGAYFPKFWLWGDVTLSSFKIFFKFR